MKYSIPSHRVNMASDNSSVESDGGEAQDGEQVKSKPLPPTPFANYSKIKSGIFIKKKIEEENKY